MPHRLSPVLWKQLLQRSAHETLSLQARIREMLVSAILDGHLPSGAPVASSRELAEELDQPALGAGDRAEMVARLDANSKAAEGEELEMVVDSDRVVLFDAETGANLFVDDQRD